MRGLNLGCGGRFHPDWENIDFISVAPGVRVYDLRKGIPYPDQTFDVVYHSHLLEHFSKQAAPAFLRECHRVLRHGGIIRVAVPDLEKIARLYLEAMEKASEGVPSWKEKYDWIILEMYDQAVRERSGGSFYNYLRQEPIPNWDFIHGRLGAESVAARDVARAGAHPAPSNSERSRRKWSYVFQNLGKVCRNKLAKMILGKDQFELLELGRFRRQGEIHQWMYDGYSLSRLLLETGFRDPRRCGAAESQVADWAKYHLDTERDGSTYKPDSMYVEAVRP